jgi:hypothetical protein
VVSVWYLNHSVYSDHFGIVKALLDADLLPRVVAGTSAGGLVAALVCTRTDDELKSILVPELARKITACSEPLQVWFRRFQKTGARFDTVDWARKVRALKISKATHTDSFSLATLHAVHWPFEKRGYGRAECLISLSFLLISIRKTFSRFVNASNVKFCQTHKVA